MRLLLVILLCVVLLWTRAAAGAVEPYSFDRAHAFLTASCLACHSGKTPAAGLRISTLDNPASLPALSSDWNRVLMRVRNGEMPPKGAPAPEAGERASFVAWLQAELHNGTCASGAPAMGAWPLRRLNRDEYSATMRDLLNIPIDAAHALPADGAGGEGFDNAAETLFISPIYAEKYLAAAKEALEYGAKDPASRAVFLIVQPGNGVSPEEAAHRILTAFVPRAFRRPAKAGEVERYEAVFAGARKRGDSFERSALFALNAVLLSPDFLFRQEAGTDDYALARRLSYFLWGSMPDPKLFELAATGTLHNPAVMNAQIARLLEDQKSREFAERFIGQWLGTRELGRDIKPDAILFPDYYDAETQASIRYEPVLFLQELLARNLSLLNLIDSGFSVLTNKTAKLYGLKIKDASQQPKRFDLPPDSHRGGVLGMAAVLAVSSYPQRTSPVLRGKWILENVLGTPPPPPPAGVPALPENRAGDAPKTLRERLERHRANAVCASCHSRIDPLGFALENYDVLGRWRTEEAGRPIDAAGRLPDGTQLAGPDDLKKALLARKETVMRNLISKMLGYALGRGLTPGDSCAIDTIYAQLARDDFKAQTLIRGIVESAPFAAAQPSATASTIKQK